MHLFLIPLLLLFCFSVDASNPAFRFDRLSIEDGLSQNSVTSIVQDQQGFLWFGTQDGLNRYDGYSFRVFIHQPQNPHSLSNNYIRTLLIDAQGRLWIGTNGGGLDRYDPKTEQFVHYKHNPLEPNSISNDNVYTLLKDADDNLWVGTNGGGLNHFDLTTEQFKRYQHNQSDLHSLSDNQVWATYLDSHGSLWVGTRGGGLNRLDDNQQKFERFVHDANNPQSISHNNVYAIIEDKDKNLWVGTRHGLNQFDQQSRQFKRFNHNKADPNSLSTDLITYLFVHSSGDLWIGTFSGGLNRLSAKEKFERFEHNPTDPHSINSNRIWSINEDNLGALWVGTFSAGISKIDQQRQSFGHINPHSAPFEGLADKNVFAIHKDNLDSVWIGTDDGLNRYNEKTQALDHFIHQPNNSNSLGHNRVWSIYLDSQHTLWIGTYGGGLNKFKPKTNDFEHFNHQLDNPNSISSDFIFAIYEDNEQQLWIGTNRGGLNHFDRQTEQFTHYLHDPQNPNTLSDNTVNAIVQDNKGNLWIGTRDGLNRFDKKSKQFKVYKHISSDSSTLAQDTIYAITQDSNGTLWIGTYGGGLNRYNPQSDDFTHFRVKDGLVNDNIFGILEDKQGYLWISTNKGISRFNLASESFKNFDVNDGLQSNEFHQGSYFAAPDGELFFGGANGFNRFYPKQIKPNTQPPKLVLTDFLLANQSVPIGHKGPAFTLNKSINSAEQLTLSYQQNLISIEFSALHFANPMKNQYAYRLQGQDDHWITTDSQNRRATYTNLTGGDYVFTVKASNKDGFWNEQGKSLKITVLPPPWKTTWAYATYLFMLVGTVWILITRHNNKILYERNLNEQLEQKINERGAQLEQKNQEVVNTQLKLVQSEKMASLGTLTAGVAHEINNPTNFAHCSAHNLNADLKIAEQFIINLAGPDAEQVVLDSLKAQFSPLYKHLETITEGTDRIKSIVQDLKDFTQADSAEHKTVKVAQLLQSTVNLVKTEYLEVANFVTDYDHSVELACNPAQLNQVFMNLIVNACDAIEIRQQYYPKHKRFRGRIDLSCELHKNTVKIVIKDNGCGMTQETKTKLFEPFYTTKGVGKGTGLGLSISFGIVQKHGGELIVQSEVDIGSIFTLNLPVVTTPPDVQF